MPPYEYKGPGVTTVEVISVVKVTSGALRVHSNDDKDDEVVNEGESRVIKVDEEIYWTSPCKFELNSLNES
jgi:hypothetical protein